MPASSTPRLRTDPHRGQRQFHIDDWTVTSTKRPILSIPEADAASAQLDLALPEICFGNNALSIRHDPSGFELEWNTLDMLAAVKKGDGWDTDPAAGAVRVAHADEWSRGQAASGSTTDLTVQKPFDWTYTTLHTGRIAASPSSPPEWIPAPPTHPGIPLALLARTDIPILFYDEVPLFEDELGDNGIADVTVRVRINHLSLFILSRFALRIDGVLFRQFDTRVFHRFGTPELVREVKGREAPYAAVRARLAGPSSSSSSSSSSPARPLPEPAGQGHRAPAPAPAPPASASGLAAPRTPFASPVPALAHNPARTPLASSPRAVGPPPEPAADLTPLTDLNWVARVLDELALADALAGVRVGDAGHGGRGGEGEGRWEGLGRRLEVLRVPGARAGEGEGAGEGEDQTAGAQ